MYMVHGNNWIKERHNKDNKVDMSITKFSHIQIKVVYSNQITLTLRLTYCQSGPLVCFASLHRVIHPLRSVQQLSETPTIKCTL